MGLPPSYSLVLAAVIFLASAAFAKPDGDFGLSQILDGPPQAIGNGLPEQVYVPFKAQRLKNAKLLWVNWDRLRDLGVRIPKSAAERAAFENQVLSRLAFVVPRPGLDDDHVTQETRELLSDRYGGDGIGYNIGSGRAGSTGRVQLKGIGRTPLVSSDLTTDHGGLSFAEAHRDAVFSELMAQELPYGANRDLFIIDTGTFGTTRSGKKTRRVILAREEPVRPAHVLEVQTTDHPLVAGDQQRVIEALKTIQNALPLPEGARPRSDAERIQLGAKEYVKRLGAQYATAFAKRLFHGSTSHSNYQVNGKFVDFGTSTALPGHGPAKVLSHVEPFGDLSAVEANLVVDFAKALNKSPAKPNLDIQELKKSFRAQYQETVGQEMLKVAGFPPEIVGGLWSSQASRRLAETLVKIASEGKGAGAVNVEDKVPASTSRYDLREILGVLARDGTADPKALGKALEPLVSSKKLRANLIGDYQDYYASAQVAAQRTGVSAVSLQRYVVLATGQRTRSIEELYRDRLDAAEKQLLEDYDRTGDPAPFAQDIAGRVGRNLSSFASAEPYELVLSDELDHETGNSKRVVFDAKSGQERVVFRFATDSQGVFTVAGKTYTRSELLAASLELTGFGSKPLSTKSGEKGLKLTFGGLPADSFGLHSLLDGPPNLRGAPLPDSSYIGVSGARLKKAKLLWTNWDALREKGISIPSDTELAKFENAVLDRIAYAIPAADGSESHAFDLANTRTFYVDRYGGHGIGYNFGSGRAMSQGGVQEKGAGETPMTSESTSHSHRHGGANFLESAADILFGELFNRELPHGANRVLFAIDTGLDGHDEEGHPFRRMMIVREDPLRPAHFMASNGIGPLRASEAARVKAAVGRVAEAFGKEKDLKGGLEVYVDRLADQYAAASARRLFHGATSPSNYEISGKFIDFATSTGLPDFGKARVLGHVEPFLDVSMVEDHLIRKFRSSIESNTHLSPGVLPGEGILVQRFRRRYRARLSNELISLAGFPSSLVERLEGTPEHSYLSNALQTIATDGTSKEHMVGRHIPERMTNYDLGEILPKLVEFHGASVAEQSQALKSVLGKDSFRDPLIEAFSQFHAKAIALAGSDGVSASHLDEYIRMAVSARTRKPREFYRPILIDEGVERLQHYEGTGDARAFARSIDGKIAQAHLTFPDAEPYQFVLGERENARNGVRVRTVYDARTGGYERIYRFQPDQSGGIVVEGKRASLEELKTLLTGRASEAHLSPVIQSGLDGLEVRVSIDDPSVQTRSLDLGLEGPSKPIRIEGAVAAGVRSREPAARPGLLGCLRRFLGAPSP